MTASKSWTFSASMCRRTTASRCARSSLTSPPVSRGPTRLEGPGLRYSALLSHRCLRNMVPAMRAFALATCLLAAAPSLAALTPEQEKQLAEATYVYVQSERKSGEWSTPAEIWFFVDGGDVYVGTRPMSWRVRRIQAGRTKARIAIGKPGGLAFEATGAVVKDPAAEGRLLDAFAKKYPEGWKRHEAGFRE